MKNLDMNYRTDLSIQYANQRNYLDDLFLVYPTIPEWIRDIDSNKRLKIESSFNLKNDIELIESLLSLDLFPIKDSYIAYLKRDKTALLRNPKTIQRICWRIYEMWLDKIFEKASEPKETNRQIWPFFRRRLKKWVLWVEPVKKDIFLASQWNAILDAWDAEMMLFAREHLNYTRNKWLDFIWRFNWKYVIWEAKFLTDFWWHQNAQFSDAISTIEAEWVNAIAVAILDWVLYIKWKNKMYMDITEKYKDKNIMSALVLREFLYQI